MSRNIMRDYERTAILSVKKSPGLGFNVAKDVDVEPKIWSFNVQKWRKGSYPLQIDFGS